MALNPAPLCKRAAVAQAMQSPSLPRPHPAHRPRGSRVPLAQQCGPEFPTAGRHCPATATACDCAVSNAKRSAPKSCASGPNALCVI
jgi:hypothetical protein